MIWIKNHGVRGVSDELRMPLSEEVEKITCHKNDPDECPSVVKMRGWTGVGIDIDVTEVKEGFESALGSQLRFAVDEASDHDDYGSKHDELNAYYANKHPDT